MTTASVEVNLLQAIRDLLAPIDAFGGTTVAVEATAAPLPDIACKHGFALQVAAGGTRVYVGGADVTSAGAHAIAVVEPGAAPLWFRGSTPHTLHAVAAQGTAQLCVRTE